MSSPIARFEAFMERLLETSIARVLDSRLDESVIMRRLERAMESNQIKRDNKVLVPHNYYAFVNPIDYKALTTQNSKIHINLTEYLVNLVYSRKFTIMQAITVQLISDSTCDLATIRIEFDPIPTASSDATDNFDAVQHVFQDSDLPTGIYTRPERFSASATYQLAITLDDVTQFIPITKTEINIGRNLQNDIVLSDHLVSRHHARINYNSQCFYMTDLASNNGTTVNGQKLTTANHRIVVDEDVFGIGSYTMQLQRIRHDE